jgi:hypothetical protein
MKRIKRGLLFLFISYFIFLISCTQYSDREDTRLFKPALRPFYHGVASGDPLKDRGYSS